MSCEFIAQLKKLRKSAPESIDDANSLDPFKAYLHVENEVECNLRILLRLVNNLFSLNTFYKANKKILAKSAPNSEAESFLITFWTLTAQNIVQWGELERKEISKIDLREKYIVTQAVVVLALGRVGATFYQAPEYTPAEILPKLQTTL